MRRAPALLLAIAALCSAAEQGSWKKINYIGGTVPVKASPYDWNTTLTITSNPDILVLVIAPATVFGRQQSVRLKPSQINSIVSGPGAFQRVGGIMGAQLPAHAPRLRSLFGLLAQSELLGILYQGDDGKQAGVLFQMEAVRGLDRALEAFSGKPLEYAK